MCMHGKGLGWVRSIRSSGRALRKHDLHHVSQLTVPAAAPTAREPRQEAGPALPLDDDRVCVSIVDQLIGRFVHTTPTPDFPISCRARGRLHPPLLAPIEGRDGGASSTAVLMLACLPVMLLLRCVCHGERWDGVSKNRLSKEQSLFRRCHLCEALMI